MLCSLSPSLDEKALKAIQNLESETGKTLLAFTCHDLKPAMLDDGQLSKIRELESDLSISLVAVDT